MTDYRPGVVLALCPPAMVGKEKMTSGWHFQGNATPTQGEVEAMVAVLESRHGTWAADVAEFFATAHGLKGDASRSWVWAGVAERVRQRAEARLGEQIN